MTTEILPMHESDLDEVLKIQEETMDSALSRDNFINELNSDNHLLFIAKNDRVVGYCVGQIIADELQIHSIAVSNSQQRLGIGTKLLKKLLDIAKSKSVSLVTLEVKTINDKAIALYQKLGFEDIGIRPKYYRDGQDALLMSIGLR